MGRQVLTLMMLFLGALLLFRMCSPPEEQPSAVRTIATPEPDEAELLVLEKNGVRALLDRSGRVVSVKRGGETVLRAVSPTHRPFQLLLRLASGATRGLKAAGWTSERTTDGWEFIHTEEERTIRKSIRINDAGDGLQMTLDLKGGGETVHGIVLTAVSGVELQGDARGGALWRIGEDPAMFQSFDQGVQYQERNRKTRRLDVAGRRVRRFGVLGSEYLVELEPPVKAEALNFEVYRADRASGKTDEIEAWIDATANQGGFEGELTLAWTPRDEVEIEGLQKPAPANNYTLENEEFRAVFTDLGAAIQQLWLKRFTLEAGQELGPDNWVPILRDGVPPGDLSLTLKVDDGTMGVDPAYEVWQAEVGPDQTSIRFTLETPRGWTLVKEIRLPEPGKYDLGVRVEITRPDNAAATNARFSLVGPAGVYIEDSFRGIIGVNPPAGVFIERRGGEDDESDLKSLSDGTLLRHEYKDALQQGLLRAVAVRGSYFVCALVTAEKTDEMARPLGEVSYADVKGIKLKNEVLRPDGDSSRENILGEITCDVPLRGGKAVAGFRLYAGPNALDDLRPLEIERTVDYGFFGFIGRALMWLMKFLESGIGSFGVAIILMTLIVRATLMPVSYRMQLGMQRYSKRLQKIKPELEALEKKYGSNKEKLNKERMRVMRENKVGFPLGCLTIFLQIPIWFALFAALRVEFSLRHQPFLWATDLSMPDRLFAFPEWFGNLPIAPDYFNLLPVVMLVLWVIQNKLSRPQMAQSDPNVEMQMKMVRYMPYVFFFMLYNYASALALYMCVSSAWGIAESKLVRRAIAKLD